ncbi:MAG: ATP-binding protein [Gammaproteobacteria bacterium]
MKAVNRKANLECLDVKALVDPLQKGFPVVYCNQSPDYLFGEAKTHVVGQSIIELLQAQVDSATVDNLCAALIKAEEATFIVKYSEGKKTALSSQITVSPLFNGGGELIHLLVSIVSRPVQPVSEQQLAEAHLFMESAPDATFIFDANGKMILTNREAETLFGYTRDELTSKTIEELMPEGYRKQHVAHRERFSRAPAVRGMGAGASIVALTKDGQELPVEIRLGPIFSQGKEYVSASVRNVEDRVRAAQELEDARDVAERATTEKSRFLNAASHDLRQPLQAITLYLSVLGRTQDSKQREDISAKIQLSLDNINSMLGALLDVSKFESGAVVPDKTNVVVADILDEIMAGCTQQADEKGLSLVAEDTSAIVYSDSALLKRVIENFVTNAIRYTDEGSITIDCSERGNDLDISVNDTGIGIDAEHLEQIFEAYYQLGNPMRNRTRGLGLGLSIVRNIARLLGNSIQVESEIGTGSTFSIRVPLVSHLASKSEDPDVQQSIPLSDEKPLVLLIDDDNDVRDSMFMLLDSLGLEVSTGLDGEKGIAILRAGARPSVIILDYWLPGMNGLEFLAQARSLLQHDVPAVIMTGDTTTTGLSDIEMSNCQIMHKPVDTQRMISLIKTAVNTKTARAWIKAGR